MTQGKLAIKIVVGLAVLTGLFFLFLKSVRDTESEPYTMRREYVDRWTVVLENIQGPEGPLLVLRPQPELPMNLFGQVFRRRMESLNAPAEPGMTLALRSEFEQAFAGIVSPAELAAVARDMGLETSTFEPRCLAARRTTQGSRSRQIFFVLFDASEFDRFRQEIGRLLDVPGGNRAAFDPGALSPILLFAASDPVFGSALPPGADPEQHCVAPIELE